MRIGIMGGTFDPVHNGHLYLAHAAAEQLDCDRVLWIPTGNPPHKQTNTDAQDRVAMLRLALEGWDRHDVDLCEVQRNGYTRTIDTLTELSRHYPTAEFVFFIGADTVLQLRYWKNFEQVAKRCRFAVAVRPEVSDTQMEEELLALEREFPFSYQKIVMKNIPVSSRMLREKIRLGEDVSMQLPQAVLSYIQMHKLYKESVS